MQNINQDLWPEDIVPNSNLITPVSILKEQASLLGQKTKNLVQAEVKTDHDDFGRHLKHSFYLLAPAMNHYRYQLFQVQHSVVSFYPADFVFDGRTPKSGEESDTADALDHNGRAYIVAESEDQFIEILQKTLADKRTKQVIQSLIVQSQS